MNENDYREKDEFENGSAQPDEPVFDAQEQSSEPKAEETAEQAQGESEEAPREPEQPQQQPQPQQGYNPPPYYQQQRPYSEPQSPYSPYSQNNYAYNYNSAAQQPVQPSSVKKRKGTGLKLFIALIAVIAVFAAGTIAVMVTRQSHSSERGENLPVGDAAGENDGGATLKISDTPESGAASGTALSTMDIAARGKASNVGIVVYNGSSMESSSSAGEGSGIVMGTDKTGKLTYIITCAHVISGSGLKATVQTEDGTSYDATIVGYDTRTDIGVLSINATGLTAAEFGNSDALKVGEPVYAVGNPGGVEFFGSFTDGFVSAIDRPISSEIGYTMTCIQHTAAINPGNSGGALLNQYGQVIGINSQKITATDYEGMGFSIPITDAQEVINDLIAYGYVPNRPKLGITYYSVNYSRIYSIVAQSNNLPAGTLIINEIVSDSSLAGTKAQKYDMITAVNGKKLTTADVLLEMIDSGKVGDKLTLTLCRVNNDYSISTFTVEATLVEDKGDATAKEPQTQQYINPFSEDYFGF